MFLYKRKNAIVQCFPFKKNHDRRFFKKKTCILFNQSITLYQVIIERETNTRKKQTAVLRGNGIGRANFLQTEKINSDGLDSEFKGFGRIPQTRRERFVKPRTGTYVVAFNAPGINPRLHRYARCVLNFHVSSMN